MKDYVLSGLIIVLAAALLFSGRFWFRGDRPMVSMVMEAPRSPELPDPESEIDAAGMHVPRSQSKVEQAFRLAMRASGRPEAPAAFTNQTPPRIGYSVREVGFLGMPFGYYTDLGWVLYTESDWGFIAAPISEKGLAAFNKAAGRDVRQGFFYPFWRHTWGWLFVAGVGLWAWMRHRDLVRRREELGLI